MSIWLFIAVISYLLGVLLHWLQLRVKFQQFDEYSNFPIVWFAKVVTKFCCFLEALFWPYSLILDAEQ